MADTGDAEAPEVCIARLPPESKAKSCTLVSRSMGYLLVRVLFQRAPVRDLVVEFGRIADVNDTAPERMDPQVTTDEEGLALFPRLVVAGIYSCHVERQSAIVVPTVLTLSEPYPIVLPVGRPLVDRKGSDGFRS